MFRKTFALLAVVVACGLALGAGKATAGFLDPVQVAPLDMRLLPVKLTRDLYVSSATSTEIRITNAGLLSTAPFTIKFSPGYIGDTCGWTVPAAYLRVSGMNARETRAIQVPTESSKSRTVTLDLFNEVSETNELNNTAIVPGSVIIC